MSENDCLFCRIVDEELPAEKVYEDEMVTAFRDIQPAAPVHILIVPNKHISGVPEIGEADEKLVGHMLAVVPKIAKDEGLSERGYRLIVNTGPDANQTVPHLHLHLLGGRPMQAMV